MEKIVELLRADDIELAQLGCNLLEKSIKKELWEYTLSKLLNARFSYEIGDNIFIRQRRGLWEQIEDIQAKPYRIHTGEFGLKMIEDAIRTYQGYDNLQGPGNGQIRMFPNKNMEQKQEGEFSKKPDYLPSSFYEERKSDNNTL